MIIKVSHTESRSMVPDIMKRSNLEFEFTNLKVGDYLVENVVPVERKEAGDYVGSLTSGHLKTQLYEMSTNAPESFLVVVGNVMEQLRERNITRSTYYSSLVGDGWKRSPDGYQGIIQVYQCETDWDFVLILKYLKDKIIKGEPRLPIIQSKTKWTERDRQIAILSSFPNVGPVRAEALLSHFGTLKNLINSDLETLRTVSNMGEKRAEQIYKIINEQYAERKEEDGSV